LELQIQTSKKPRQLDREPVPLRRRKEASGRRLTASGYPLKQRNVRDPKLADLTNWQVSDP